MLYLTAFKKSKGQALVEAALIAPLIVLFLFTVIWFARVMLTWQQLITAARYGTDMMAYTPFSKTYIEKDIENYLCSAGNVGRILERDKLTVEAVPKDYKKQDFTVSFSNLESFNPLNLAERAKGILPVAAKSYVKITYKYRLPPLFRIAGREDFEIRAYSEVLTGTGSPGQQDREQ